MESLTLLVRVPSGLFRNHDTALRCISLFELVDKTWRDR